MLWIRDKREYNAQPHGHNEALTNEKIGRTEFNIPDEGLRAVSKSATEWKADLPNSELRRNVHVNECSANGQLNINEGYTFAVNWTFHK